jgi:putative effector of murein hydrolase LrgA (UPF0299 family)
MGLALLLLLLLVAVVRLGWFRSIATGGAFR